MDDPPTPDDLHPDTNGLADSEDDGDLFGDDDGDVQDTQDRKLDDSDLDSGDDEGRADRLAQTVEDDADEDQVEHEDHDLLVCSVDFPPVRCPEGDEMYLLNMPSFLGLSHKNFNSQKYQPPKHSHDDPRDGNTDPNFTPFSTATSTIFWRRDPHTPSKLQSNARIVRWSDGSLTLQHAGKPSEQFSITTKPLRQHYNPKTNRLQPSSSLQYYDPNKDSNDYLAAPQTAAGFVLQTVRPIDASMRIQATGALANSSLHKLQASLLANAKTHDPLASMKIVTKDPEREKLEAEKAEKDIARTLRKQENARERNEARRQGVLGRSGMGGSGRSAGLTVGGLEDDDEGLPSAASRNNRSKAAAAAARRRKTNRRGEIYSDDEDDTLPRGRQDEYDRDDGFLVDSDEEPDMYDDDGEGGEDILDDDDEDAEGEVDDEVDQGKLVSREKERDRERVRDRREGTPKRPAEDDDGPGGAPNTQGSPQARKKRRVIDDDEDDE